MDAILGLAGGVGLVVVPYLCLRAFATTPDAKRIERNLYAVATAVGLLLCLYLVVSSWTAMLGIVGAVAGIQLYAKSRRVEPDIVVEGPLLGEAMSPELAAQLSSLEERVRKGERLEDDTDERFTELSELDR